MAWTPPLPAQYVRPYVRRNKTDRADAEALLEAHRCGEIHVVPVKTVEQQALQALHRVRTQWQTARTARILLDRRPGRKVEAMKLAFELPPAQADRLKKEAARLGVAPDELAKAALSDLLANQDPDFEAAARRVLDRNRELYRRLA